jgi:hypothetical protein
LGQLLPQAFDFPRQSVGTLLGLLGVLLSFFKLLVPTQTFLVLFNFLLVPKLRLGTPSRETPFPVQTRPRNRVSQKSVPKLRLGTRRKNQAHELRGCLCNPKQDKDLGVSSHQAQTVRGN